MSRTSQAILWTKFCWLPNPFRFVPAPDAKSVVFGQVDEGSISGVVQDPTGAVVPNAQVTLLNTDQGITVEHHYERLRRYTFSPVRIGNYTVSVTAPGFSKTDSAELQVTVESDICRSTFNLRPAPRPRPFR